MAWRLGIRHVALFYVIGERLIASGWDDRVLPRIYTYPLPDCSFDNFSAADIDGDVAPFHNGRPPALPIHERLARGRYATSDPANATTFYIPAPFFLWDSSWTTTEQRAKKCAVPLYARNRLQAFDVSSGAIVLPNSQSILGSRARTVMVWMKSARFIVGQIALLAMGFAAFGRLFSLGILDGCPIVSGCGVDHISACNYSVIDGSWHHIAVTFDGHMSRIYVDGDLCGAQQPMELDTSPGPMVFGGINNQSACSQGQFSGEMRNLLIYDVALPPAQIRKCGIISSASVERSVDSRCFQLVRRTIEDSPWFKKSSGWDHFVLFAGADYPSMFDPIHAPKEEDYVLESAWPAFGNFTVLHFGSRAERCFASFANPAHANSVAEKDSSCVRRFFRTITIPPFLSNERFDCREMMMHVDGKRKSRIGYRGLAYSAMIERMAMYHAASMPDMHLLQESRQMRLEFTNWTHELVESGRCTANIAFEGLCPWKDVGRSMYTSEHGFGKSRASSMKRRALELWASSETCLVLGGDGGFELRLFSMVNLGCIPVIVHAVGVSLPKLPFVRALPWHEFSIIWSLDSSSQDMMVKSAHQLLTQLLHLDSKVILRKRAALLQHAHFLSWNEQRGTSSRCGGKGKLLGNALDLLVDELAARSKMPAIALEMIQHENWDLKIPFRSMEISAFEDLTGNSCPSGWPFCEIHHGDPSHSDVCKAEFDDVGYRCPLGCKQTESKLPPYCVRQEDSHSPCHTMKCLRPIEHVEPDMDEFGFRRLPKLAIVSSSTQRSLSSLTRPSLIRFCAEHPGRYDLLIEDDLLLDPRDWHPSWNKLAHLKRALVMGSYDAVVWIDDDVLITQPTIDPIYDAIVGDLLNQTYERLVIASKDIVNHGERYPLNTGILVLKKGRPTMKLLENIFRIGARRHALDGVLRSPRKDPWFEQDAFAVYIQEFGGDFFELLEHRKIQSFVRPDAYLWQLGDFAAHFSFLSVEDHLDIVRNFIQENASYLMDHERS